MPRSRRPWTVTPHDSIEKLDDNLWAVNGKVPGAPMHRRMCIVKRSDGRLLFFHAIPLDEATLSEVTAWGQPAFLVVGHALHAADADAFSKRLGLKIFGPKQVDVALRERVDLAGHLEDVPADPAVKIESVAGTKNGEAVMSVSSGGGQRLSLLFCDALQNNAAERTNLLVRLAGFAGGLKVPPVFKLVFVSDRKALRAHLEKLAALPGLSRLVPCHGDVLSSGVPEALHTAASRLEDPSDLVSFDRLGAFIYRHRWPTLAAAGVFLLASLLILLRGGDLTSGVIKDLESERAQPLIEQVLGYSLEQTFVALFQSSDLDPDDDDFQAALKAALAPVRADPAVLRVVTPEEAPQMLELSRINNAARAVMVLVSLRGDFKQALHAYGPLRERLHSDKFIITCTGRIPFLHDLDKILEHDLLRAEAVSLPIAVLLLLLVFGGVVAAVIPVGVGGLAVAGGMAIVFLLSRRLDIAQYTINVCSLIGLGVAIDYSLFIVSRYREELAAGHDTEEALRRAVATAGRMVAFSGLAVGSGMAGLLFFENSYLWAMGLGGAIVVALAIVFALTFLPALLAVLGPRIQAGRLFRARVKLGDGLWHRTATWVMRRPLRVLFPTLALLLLMGVPFLHLRMIASDVRVLPLDAEARRGYELLKKDFPDQAEPRILVAVQFPTAPALDADRIGALFDLSRRIAAIPHVRKVESIVDGAPFNTKGEYRRMLLDPPPLYAATVAQAKQLTVSERVVLLSVVADAPPESQEDHRIVEAIREHRQVADGELLVGGQTANDVDASNYILSRTPRAVGFVVGVMLVILFLLLGLVVLPLKAVAMNFVSVAGSFGALVWVFQDGHLFVHEGRPVEPSLPVLLFCILFGLSMDYEVLMLSRIKESYERTGDNTAAVAEGLEKTAGLITSAAAIMVAVFGAFALATVVLVKAVGFGMALAVALDATLVRVLLVPATMRLFGDLNWWAPEPLLKLRRFLGMGAPHG